MEIRRATILGFTFFIAGLVLCGVGLWLLLSPAQYRATARIMVNPDMPPISGNRQGTSSYDPYFIQTEFEVVQSQVVLGKAISALNLNVVWGKKYNGGAILTTNETMAFLKRHLQIAPVRNTRLIEVSFTSGDSNDAAKIANAIAEAYQNYRLELRRQMMLKGIEVLQQQYQEEATKIQIQQTNLDLLREKLKIHDDDSSTRNGSEPVSFLISDFGKVNTNALAEQPYWETKRKLENMLDFHELLQAKITAEKLDLQIPKTMIVAIVNAAQPPELPAGPNRPLGAALLAIGLFSTIGGFLMLKSSRRSSV